MNYCIVKKIEVVDSVLIKTEIGLVQEGIDCQNINNGTLANFESWIETNKSSLENGTVQVETYFDSNPPVYEARTTTQNIWGLGLEMLDINNLP